MVIKTYFDKNNTIIFNERTNTGRNPVTEIFHGGKSGNTTFSRFLFQFEEDRIKDFYTGGTFADLTKLKHTLKMTNTSCFDTDLLGQSTCGGKKRACSFDLVLFRIDQPWDEGCGYDFDGCTLVAGDTAIAQSPSNWIEPRTGESWSGGNGVYTGTTSSAITITTQHFDAGNENIEMDITDEVNAILTGATNEGFGIAFISSQEQGTSDDVETVGFFTRHTQTFFEPFIESVYTNPILDDRANFFLDKTNKLYLYTNLGADPVNLDTPPGVTILDHEGTLFSAFTSSTQVSKGVYCVEFSIPTTIPVVDDCDEPQATYTDCVMFQDVWSGITIDGLARPDVTMEFVLEDSSKYFNFGSNEGLPKPYGFSVSGIKYDEKVFSGDMRKIVVHARVPFTVDQKEIIDKLQYRLYIKEGRSEITVIDFQDVERTFNNNYFLLDTLSLVPNTYYLDVKAESNLQIKTLKETLRFELVNTPTIRK